MRNKRLLEYIKTLQGIAGKRHKGRNGAICKILASMEKELGLHWWQKKPIIYIPSRTLKAIFIQSPPPALETPAPSTEVLPDKTGGGEKEVA
jgi:hypothetical protein